MINFGMKIGFGFLLLALFLFESCTYTNIQDNTEREFQVGDYNRIYIKGSFAVKIEQGTESEVIVKGMKESVQTVEVSTDTLNQTLLITREQFSMSNPELTIRCRALNGIRIEGGASLISDGYLDLDTIDIRVEGAATLNLKMKAKTVHVRGEGGVIVELEGYTSTLDAKLFGASYLKARELHTDSIRVHVEGVGVAVVNVDKYLNTRVLGLGKISYVGNPDIDQSSEGLTKIEQQ